MNIKNIKLTEGYLIVQQEETETKTKSGIILNENTDDFIVFAEVKVSGSKKFKKGVQVIYHVLDCESFRDKEAVYYLVHEDKVKGQYAEEK